MPVTAKFSEMFYERFGHELTDEFVSYLNQIDTTYRSELRELNELNFARFDAKLEQRISELRFDFERGITRLDSKFEQKIGELDAKFDRRVSALETKLDSKIDQRTAELRGEMAAGFASCKAELIKWMFVFWAGTTVTVVGTMIALVQL